MDKIHDLEFIFDAVGADMFVRIWNDLITEYGFISLADVLDNQLLLGQFDDNRIDNKFVYNCCTGSKYIYGWTTRLSVASAFEIRKGYRNYEYILKLPIIEPLRA